MRSHNSAIPIAVVLTVLIALAGPVSPANAGDYTFFSYQDPAAGPPSNPNFLGSSNFGISNTGVVLGNYGVPDGSFTIYGYIQRGNSFSTVLGPSPFSGTLVDVYKMNSSGNIVGDYIDPATPANTRAFVLHPNGQYTLIDYPAAQASGPVTITTARGINDAGTIVGRWDDANGTHGFILQNNGVIHELSASCPGSIATGLWFINNNGVFGGDYETPDLVIHGLIVSGSTITTITIPWSTFTIIHDLNDNGLAVGIYVDPTNPLIDHSFLYNLNTNQITPLNFPGAPDTDLYGINDAGVIAGTDNKASRCAVLRNPRLPRTVLPRAARTRVRRSDRLVALAQASLGVTSSKEAHAKTPRFKELL